MKTGSIPKVSIVIPAYNRAGTVGRAIDGALAQTFQDFEIIVVDDASTDDTAGVVQTYADSRICYLRNERNSGAGSARNVGIEAASGEYVAFLDSDDVWLPTKLSKQMRVLKETGVDASCTGYNLVITTGDGTKLSIREEIAEEPESWFKELLLGCDLGPGTTLIVRRSVMADVGLFDEGLPRLEDWEWLLRFAKNHQLGMLEEPLAHVHRSADPPLPEPTRLATLRIIDKHRQDFEAFGRCYRRKAIGRRWLELGWCYHLNGLHPKAWAYLLRALTSHPGVFLWAIRRRLRDRSIGDWQDLDSHGQ